MPIYEYIRMSLGVILLILFIFFQDSNIWFYPKSPYHLVLGWFPKKFLVGISSYEVGLYPNQILIRYSLKLCVTIALEYLADRV